MTRVPLPILRQPVFLILLLAGVSFHSLSQTVAPFPLRFGDGKRHLVDAKGQPFLITEFSSWGLIQVLPEPDAAAFLDSLREKGFNTVLASIISNAPSQMGGDPPNWNGISPFRVKWDFSTPNEAYFKHVDAVLKMAADRGLLVMAVPVYMGYRGDPSQGWFDEVLSAGNDTTKMFQYGAFLGRRYRDTPNLMWVAGGDNNCDGQLYPYMHNVIKGIKSQDDPHLWTGHFDSNLGVFWSTDNPLYEKYMDIDGQYAWTESLLSDRGPQYMSELRQYRKGKMTLQLDQSYEHDFPYFADNENPQWLRRKMYDGLLSGCAGTSFGSGTIGNSCVSFKNWKPLMNTNGMMEASYCFRLFNLLPWHALVPDETNEIIFEGRGRLGDIAYACAAQSRDRKYYVVYLPVGQSIAVNVARMSDKPMRMHWYNPRTGQALRIGVVDRRERFGIVPPSTEDWVLIFDSDDKFALKSAGAAFYSRP